MWIASDIHHQVSDLIDSESVTITDNGTIGEDVDYNELLFVGGEEITAGTMTQKDGTMFLGDIKIKRPQIKGDYSNTELDINSYTTVEGGNKHLNEAVADDIMVNIIRKEVTKTDTNITSAKRACYIPLTMNSASYKWGNTLDARLFGTEENPDSGESTNIAGFKYGEHYRLGLQFQYKTGKWSQPVFISDETIKGDNKPSLDTSNGYCKQDIPIFRMNLPKLIGEYMVDKEYKRVRPVVCFPTESDQLILCQGLLNPTVHSIAGRLNHTPDVQSSWYFRPVPSSSDISNDVGYSQYKNNYTLYGGDFATI